MSYSAAVLQDSPIHYWRMGETSGSTFANAVSGGFTLTRPSLGDFAATGPLTSDKGRAQAVTNGVGYDFPYNTSPGTLSGQSGSVEFWARNGLIQSPSGFSSGVALGNLSGTSYYFLFGFDTFGCAAIHLQSFARTAQYRTDAVFSDELWHHFVFSSSGSAYSIYVDGVLRASTLTVASGGLNGDWFSDVSIINTFAVGGLYSHAGIWRLNGAISEVAVYATPLSQARVTAHYAAGRLDAIPAVPAAQTLALSPRHWWRFGEASGAVIDHGRMSANLLWHGSPPTRQVDGALLPEDPDGAVAFGGVDTYARVGYSNLSSAGSVAFWIKTEALAWTVFSAADTNAAGNFVKVHGTSTYVAISTESAGVAETTEAETSLSDGLWHHVVITASGSAYAFYVDGEPLSGVSGSNTGKWFSSLLTPVDTVALGAAVSETVSEFFEGSLDEVSVYDEVLSDLAALRLYTSSRRPYHSRLLRSAAAHWWPLGEPSGQAVSRISSSPRPLTWFGSPDRGVLGIYKSDAAVVLDGTDDYAKIDAESFPAGSSGSVSLWFKTTADGYFFSSCDDESATNRFGVFLSGEGTPIIMTDTGTPNYVYSSDAHGFNDGLWHHLVVRGGTAYDIYVDGQRYPVTAGVNDGKWFSGMPSGRDNFVLGGMRYNGVVSGLFAGSLDEVAVYSRRLAPAEIAAQYSLGFTTGVVIEESLSAAVAMITAAGVPHEEFVLDTAALDEFPNQATLQYVHLLNAAANIVGSSSSALFVYVNFVAQDSLRVRESIAFGGHVNVQEVVSITAGLVTEVAWALQETLRLAEELFSGQVFEVAAADGFRVRDSALRILELLVTDAVNTASPLSAHFHRMLAVAERLYLSGSVDTQLQALQLVADTVLAAASTDPVHFLTVRDEVSSSDAVVALRQVIVQTLSQLSVSSPVAPSLTLVMSARDETHVGDASAGFLDFIEQVQDGVSFVGTLVAPSGEHYRAFGVTLSNKALYEYNNYPFNSFATHADLHYGLSADGLYLLEGDDDAGEPISAHFKTGLMDFGTAHLKNVSRAYIAYSSDGALYLRVTDTDTGDKREITYELTETHDAFKEARIKLGKGVRARYFQFELANVDGADFNIDELSVLPVVLKRRV
jgi:hypothetical protein